MSAVSRLGGGLAALAGGILASLALIAVGPLLMRPTGPPHALDTHLINAFIPPPAPPPPEEEEPPPKPEPPPKLEVTRLEMQPLNNPQPQLERPRLDFDLNPRLQAGIAVAPPGPARFELGQVDRAPMVTGQIPPPYPYLARRRGMQGAVTVRFLVDAQGAVSRVTIVDSQPPGVFDDSVLSTVPRWRFRPGVKDGAAVETWVETTIRFKLER